MKRYWLLQETDNLGNVRHEHIFKPTDFRSIYLFLTDFGITRTQIQNAIETCAENPNTAYDLVRESLIAEPTEENPYGDFTFAWSGRLYYISEE